MTRKSQSTVGFHNDGNGQFMIEQNNFGTPGRGVQFYDCGFNSNRVEINRFNSAYIGANSNKINSGLRYWGNCFENNSAVDINNQNGNVFPYQGDPLNAAGNCFEGFAIDISNKGGTGNLFYFVHPNTPQTNCKYPKNASLYNFTVLAMAANDEYVDCASFPFFAPESTCDISEDASIAELTNARQQIQSLLSALPSQYTTGSWELDYWTETYRACIQEIDDLVGRKSFVLGSSDPLANKEAAISYFNSCGDFMNRSTAYGIMVTFGEYTRARAYLDSLPAQTTDELTFKWVQEINLDFLQNRFEYSLEEEDRLQLEQIGRANGPYNGYARALYRVLTGERIEVTFAELEEPEAGERAIDKEIGGGLTISTFPNPVRNGKLSLFVSGLKGTTVLRSILFDARGIQSVHRSVGSNGTFSMDVENLPTGVYFLKVCNAENEVVHQTKVIILD